MAKIVMGDNEVEVKDGDSIIEACEKLGVPFSCKEGTCGVCNIKILEGADNLSDLTDNEKNFGMSKDSRLACQCRIKSGVVKINY